MAPGPKRSRPSPTSWLQLQAQVPCDSSQRRGTGRQHIKCMWMVEYQAAVLFSMRLRTVSRMYSLMRGSSLRRSSGFGAFARWRSAKAWGCPHAISALQIEKQTMTPKPGHSANMTGMQKLQSKKPVENSNDSRHGQLKSIKKTVSNKDSSSQHLMGHWIPTEVICHVPEALHHWQQGYCCGEPSCRGSTFLSLSTTTRSALRYVHTASSGEMRVARSGRQYSRRLYIAHSRTQSSNRCVGSAHVSSQIESGMAAAHSHRLSQGSSSQTPSNAAATDGPPSPERVRFACVWCGQMAGRVNS